MVIKLKHIGATAIILTLSSAAFAMGPGWYLGFGGGASDVHAKKQTFDTPNGPLTINPTTSGIGERLYMGYDINPYAGMEFGFFHYGTATYKIPADSMISCNNPSIRQNGFDIEGKAMFPFQKSGISVFGEFGMAVVYAGSSGSLQPDATTNPCGAGGTSSKASARPLYGLGANYDFNQTWQGTIDWQHINGGGNIQTTDFIALSISYHFTDTYCGQFLC